MPGVGTVCCVGAGAGCWAREAVASTSEKNNFMAWFVLMKPRCEPNMAVQFRAQIVDIVSVYPRKFRVNPWQRSFTARRYQLSGSRERTAKAGPPHTSPNSHAVVVRAATSFRRHPGDDLVWVLDVAGLAVNAVRRIQADALAVGLARVVYHFVDICGAEILAGAAEFLHTTLVANVSVVNDQVRRLVFFVLRARVIQIGQLIECQLAITLRRADDVPLRSSVRRQLGKLLHALVSRHSGVAIAQAAAAADHLQSGMDHARVHPMLKSLMQVAHLPQLFFDPAGFHFLLELAEARG